MEDKTYVLCRFSRKSGKIDTTLEGLVESMLRLWALQNTTKTKDTIIFEKDTGTIVFYCEGTASGFPEVTDIETWHIKNIEQLCPGLLGAVNDEEI